MKSEIQELKTIVEEWQMRTARYRIIRFDDEEQHGIEHTDDHWDDVLESCDIYQTYVDSHPDFHNHKGQAAMQRTITTNMNGRNRVANI